MARRDIVVVGASAGGVETLQQLVRTLPASFPASLFVTVHFPAESASVLPKILSRCGPLTALHAADGDAIIQGRIYVAPPDHHLLIHRDCLALARGPRENGNRPAIDPMFRSAAVAFGERVIGIVLTGTLDDGTAGARAIKRAGGVAIAQDPRDALFSSMPQSAIEHGSVDRVLPVSEMGAAIIELITEEIRDGDVKVSLDDAIETEYSAGELEAVENPQNHPGKPSPYGCPDCGGVLWEIKDGELERFRCRVGHGWTGDALLARQSRELDDALWAALRGLEERASLSRQIAKRWEKRGMEKMAQRFIAQADEAENRARIVRDTLMARG
jgi:two-component system, chemotaxis family, protein-glutamate methylesterase/glutaminase